MISYKLQTLNFSEDINELLCQLDSRISKIAKNKLDSIRYGVDCVKTHEDEYFILVKYKHILLEKANNSKCLAGYLIDDIISIIKQYLSLGKVQKFQFSTITSTKVQSPYTADGGVKVTINYNYGDYIVNNSYSNRYVTEVVEDSWDQIDW